MQSKWDVIDSSWTINTMTLIFLRDISSFSSASEAFVLILIVYKNSHFRYLKVTHIQSLAKMNTCFGYYKNTTLIDGFFLPFCLKDVNNVYKHLLLTIIL